MSKRTREEDSDSVPNEHNMEVPDVNKSKKKHRINTGAIKRSVTRPFLKVSFAADSPKTLAATEEKRKPLYPCKSESGKLIEDFLLHLQAELETNPRSSYTKWVRQYEDAAEAILKDYKKTKNTSSIGSSLRMPIMPTPFKEHPTGAASRASFTSCATAQTPAATPAAKSSIFPTASQSLAALSTGSGFAVSAPKNAKKD